VTVSGTIHYQGAERGSLRVDALRRGALEDGQPRMIATTAAAGDGSWQLAIPEGSGTVDLWGYLDRDDNGPSLTEPKLLVDGGVTVDSAPVTGLVLRVEDGWDDQHPTTLDQLYLAPESTGPTPPPPGAQVKP
jgi:hypothetical protein